MKILVINGPNINMLGIREKNIYGTKSYADLCEMLEKKAKDENLEIKLFQSLIFTLVGRDHLKAALYSSPQFHRASKMGFRLFPSSVSVYSTRGGTSA